MSVQKILLVGCGGLALLLMLSVLAAVGWIWHASKDVEGVSVVVDAPLDVTLGETFTMKVIVKNERGLKILNLSDVDISDEYLSGFVVISTDPEAKSSMHIPVDDSMRYTFDIKILAGEEKSFSYTLRAEQEGIYRGDVDVCEGSRYISAMAQSVVKQKAD